jgi:hypothetical protein
MISRAGYPTIANDVDEELVQAMLPAIEDRCWELVGMNTDHKPANDQRKTKAELIAELEDLRAKVGAR